MTALLREPLVHFLALGALLFGLHSLLQPPAEPAPEVQAVDRRILVDATLRSALAEAYLAEEGAAPSPQELDARIERYIDEEVLYREGLSRELDAHDERVRARVISLMADVVAAQQHLAPLTDEEIRGYFDAHPERWAEPSRMDFVHVFFPGTAPDADASAADALVALQGGASPTRMGETFSGGRHYRGRRIEDIEASFGSEFAQALADAPLEAWFVARSRFGMHVVRVESRSAGGDADFERVRADVVHALDEERRFEATHAGIASLRSGWRIEREETDR